ncbi:methyltransferase domain-containing protein [Paenibacillus sp. KQZ6P-2]|uniref:Methyltransferase domain-containing protein n=1 Tax=Paenibacillus mangrovi TaxID=2931978 RepID=A0A9X2B4T2_9BACL|nr:methyltransferase domain-containing protein [Paenibacillus mangrovi]MCJ8011927.1 methyltransferase domain-containing protein [Paenibacillus mangrovi]
MSNKEMSLTRARLMALNEHIFRCPVCFLPMKMNVERSLACAARHNFDLSKDGYVHLLPGAKPSKYDKELFEARRLINASGFFDPLLDSLVSGISGSLPLRLAPNPLSVLDAGCGEGSHLMHLRNKLPACTNRDILAVGADSSKPGIIKASKSSPDILWCVADLAHSPFQDQTFDVIVNILSPSNYVEFKRLLTETGMLVKVIPGPGYLQEFREILLGRSVPTEREVPDDTATLFVRHFPQMKQQRVRYEIELDPLHLKAMLRMTPLTWHAPEEKIRALMAHPFFRLTFDFYILWGRQVRCQFKS